MKFSTALATLALATAAAATPLNLVGRHFSCKYTQVFCLSTGSVTNSLSLHRRAIKGPGNERLRENLPWR